MSVVLNNNQPYTSKDAGFWRAAVSLGCGALLVFSALYAFQPLLPIFASEFHLTATTSSLLMSMPVITMIPGLLILGFVSDRYGRTVVMKISLLFVLSSLLIMPFMNSFLLLLIIRCIEGFFLAGIPASAMAYLADEVAPSNVGLATSIFIASNAMGGLSGRVATGYLTDLYSWQVSFIILAGFAIIAIICFYWLLPPSRFFKGGNSSVIKDMKGMFVHLRDRRLLSLFTLGFLIQVIFTGVWTYLPFFLKQDPFSLSLKWISLAYFAYILGVVSPPIAGRISSRIGLRRTMVTGLLLLTLGVAITLYQELIVVMIGLCVICAGFFISHSMASASVAKTAEHHKSGASSFYLISYYAGVAAGSSGVGILWDGLGWIGVVSLLILIVPLLLLFSQKQVSKRYHYEDLRGEKAR
ncbi:MFS transporter [Alkalihalobacillus hwajinpoensis]|uniref:MFS transporter n=1 Tax=Guptibacillus hwajinpoensis TaxID=208199 RepID=UPI0018846101|nr:MFS transporter [Pseudalkalibacillus hwajinpoensis]MBF0709142.1 MFS transporter [Pseudalkalibacillus hwajinpoensis]